MTMNKKAHGITIQQLMDRGFTKRPDGSWGKGDADPPHHPSGPPGPVAEPGAGQAVKGKAPRKKRGEGLGPKSSERFQLVIVSYRSCLIDNSNAYIKHIEDAFVVAGTIPDDAPRYCPAPRFIQCKVKRKDERTEVYLFKLNPTETANRSQGGPATPTA